MFVRFAAIAAVIAASASVDARSSRFKGLLRSDDDGTRRELKSSKKSKGTTPVCLSFGEVDEIKGTDEVQVGQATTPECNAFDIDTWDSEECDYYEGPFFLGAGSATGNFVFDDGTLYNFTDPPLGDGAFCGSVGSTASDKVTLTYIGDLTDLSAPTFDLQNKTAKHLQNMKYSFWVESCATAGSSPCPKEFYLNIYTRRNGSDKYYDCRFDYVPTQGGEVGTWTTFDLYDILNVPATANPFVGGFFGSTSPDCTGQVTTLQEYIDAEALIDSGYEVVLGTTYNEVFKLNAADTNPKDGTSGCFDALELKLTDEDATRVYDFEN